MFWGGKGTVVGKKGRGDVRGKSDWMISESCEKICP